MAKTWCRTVRTGPPSSPLLGEGGFSNRWDHPELPHLWSHWNLEGADLTESLLCVHLVAWRVRIHFEKWKTCDLRNCSPVGNL